MARLGIGHAPASPGAAAVIYHGGVASLAAPAHASGASAALQRNPQRSRPERAFTGCRGREEIRWRR